MSQNPFFMVVLSRWSSKRSSDSMLAKQIGEFKTKVLSRSSNWKVSQKTPNVAGKNGGYETTIVLKFERTSGQSHTLARQFEMALQALQDYGQKSKWGCNVWKVSLAKKSGIPDIATKPLPTKSNGGGGEDDVRFDRALSLDEIGEIIQENEVLVSGTDKEIEKHPHFNGIYARGAQIRVCFASIRRFVNTNGKRRHHCLLFGPPGTAKSHIFAGIRKVLGLGAYYDLNSDSSTKAGVQEKLLRLHDDGIGIPPVVFIEEIEKAPGEHVTTPWLSILDDRQELRKLTAHKARRIDVNVLCFATCNDKRLFDSLHGGRPGFPGALSSRFCNQLHVPRPSWDVMRRILIREISEYGGDINWVDPCIQLAKDLECDDPRRIISFLNGENRLLDGSYQEDILAIEERRTIDDEENLDELEEIDKALDGKIAVA